MTNFWRNWMLAWCFAVGLFGVVLAAGGLEIADGVTHFVFSLLNKPEEFNLTPHLRFSLSVLGAVTIGWSVSLWAAINAANQLGKQSGRSTWILVTVSVLSWYVIDSTLSVATGFWLNTIPNTIFAAAFLFVLIGSGVITNQKSDG